MTDGFASLTTPPSASCAVSQSPVHSGHIGQEVEVHYRWHSLYGRRVRQQNSEQRASGHVVHVETAPGVIIVLAAWMLDPAACAGMEIGAPHAEVTALIDLHRLLVERGFRRSSLGDLRIAKEEQNEQAVKVGSNNVAASHCPTPIQHRVRFYPAARHEHLGSRESGCVLGQPLDASGGRRDAGAQQ